MKKIKSLFKRDYDKNSRQVFNEVVAGSEWVLNGEGTATLKWDGTSCMIRDGQLYKRYDRKLTKHAHKMKRSDKTFTPLLSDFKPAPQGWEAAEKEPNIHTGHWPGWLLVNDEPQNKWHNSVDWNLPNGTYELVGPKIQNNPHNLTEHILVPHGEDTLNTPRTFDELNQYFAENEIEGIVWHHEDGRMVKIKRSDFGYKWGK